MQTEHDYYHNPSIFDAYDEDLKTAEKILEQLEGEAAENGDEWLAENLEVSKEAVKEKRGVR
jgi:hypothetical protein